MATTPFFPPVNNRDQLAATVSGVWEPITEKDFLLKLAGGMTLHTPENTNLSKVRALPDVWGQLVAFQAAWEDLRHPLEKRATAEWRGVLALLGLADWRRQPLHRVEVDLKEMIESPFTSGAPADPKVPNLGRVIETFMPRHEHAPFHEWGPISILLHGARREDAQTIALMTPSTLIVPSRTYELKAEDAGVPWVEKGGYPLIDPVPFLTNARERQALADYLSRLRAAVDGWDLSGQARRRSLATRTIGRLDDFIRDLRVSENAPAFFYTDTLVETLPPWHRLAPLCSVPKRGGTVGSDTRLPFRRELRGKVSGAALYGRALTTASDRAGLSVWGDYPLDDLPPEESPAFQEIIRDVNRAGLEMLDAGTLLSATLMRVDGDEAETSIPGHPGEWSRFLLPVDPRLLAFMTVEEIWSNLALETTKGGYAVSLSLTLTRRDGGAFNAKVRREYRTDDRSLISVDLPAALEIWPNFVAEDWRHHYIDTTDYDNEGATTRPYARVSGAVAPRAVMDFLESGGTGDVLSCLAQGLDAEERYCLKLIPRPSVVTARTLRLMARAPEALTLDINDKRRGLIALRWNRPEPVTGEWKAAVDFGASGTTILVKPPGAASSPKGPQPKRWWADLLFRRLGVPRAPAIGTLPRDEIAWPALSMLYDPPAIKQGAPDEALRVFERATPVIGQAEEFLWRRLADVKEEGATLLFGLKYGEQVGSGAYFNAATRLFLKSMLLGAAAEVVGDGGRLDTILWRTAHPASMFDSEIVALTDSMRRAIASVETSPLKPPAPKPELRSRMEPFTENRAITDYLTTACDQDTHRLSIVFDIGGFSTDIAIWNAGRLLWAGSLVLAGHDVFNDYFATTPFRVDQLVANESAQLNKALNLVKGDGKSGTNETGRRGIVEMHLRQPRMRDSLARLLPATAGANGLARLQNVVRFTHAAFLAYLRLVIAKIGAPREELSKGVNLFYGGRGGQLISSFLSEGVIERDAREYLQPGGAIASVNTFFSPAPKEEVARGLLMIDRPAEQAPLSMLPMGEAFWMVDDMGNRIAKTPNDWVSVKDVDSVQREVVTTDYDAFARSFTDAFSEPADIANDGAFQPALEAAFDQELKRARAARRQASQQAQGGEAPIQPMFILAVRTAIRLWHQRT